MCYSALALSGHYCLQVTIAPAWAGLNDGLFSETMDFRDFPSVLSAVRIAQS